jgi:hypothetical protein
MAKRGKIFGLLILAIALAAIAYYYVALREQPATSGGEEMGQIEPIEEAAEVEVEYEFVWREGDVRGVDIPVQVIVPSTGKPVPIHFVQDMMSHEGESELDFLHRVREVMAAYSDKHTHEVCGEICSDGSTRSIRITTNGSVKRCAVVDVCMPGQSSTGSSIHSHCPSRGRGSLKANLADEYLTEGKVRKGTTLPWCNTEKFSVLDLTGRRPGWLAGRRALHRHEGPKRLTTHERDARPGQADSAGEVTAN